MEQSALDLLSLAAATHHESTPSPAPPPAESTSAPTVEQLPPLPEPIPPLQEEEEDDGDRTEEEDLSHQHQQQNLTAELLLPPLPIASAPVPSSTSLLLAESSLPPLPSILTSLPPLPLPLPIPAVSPSVIEHLVPEDSGIIRCVCPYTDDDGFTIQCDTCNVWQHANCVEINQEDVPEEYLCELCDAEGARKRGVDRVKAELGQRKRIEAERMRGNAFGMGGVEMGRGLSIGLSARGGRGRGGTTTATTSRKNSNNANNHSSPNNHSDDTPYNSSTPASFPPHSAPSTSVIDEPPPIKIDRRRRGAKQGLLAGGTSGRSRSATQINPVASTSAHPPTVTSIPVHDSSTYFASTNNQPHHFEDDLELGSLGLGAGLGNDEQYELWQYEFTPVEKNLWSKNMVEGTKELMRLDEVDDFPTFENGLATVSTSRPRSTTTTNTLSSLLNDLTPIKLGKLPESLPIQIRPILTPSFSLNPPSSSQYSSTSSQTPLCPYPTPTTYHVLSTSPIPANTYIGPLRGRITSLEDYRKDPVNQYDLLGLPKFCVRAFGRPWSLVVDMRLWGTELRFARSGCHPNAGVRVVRVKKENGGEEDLAGNLWREQKWGNENDLDELTFAVYSLREIGKKEEIVLPWDWDDSHLVHLLPSLMSFSTPDPPPALEELSRKFSLVANTLLGTFNQCGCTTGVNGNGNKKNCCLFWLSKGSSSNIKLVTREPFGVLFLNALGAGVQDGRKKGRGGKKVDLGGLVGLERGWVEVKEKEKDEVKAEPVEEEATEEMDVDTAVEEPLPEVPATPSTVVEPITPHPDPAEESDDSDLTEPLSHPSDSEHNSSAAESEDEIIRKPIARRRLVASGNRKEPPRKKVKRDSEDEGDVEEEETKVLKRKKKVISANAEEDNDEEADLENVGENDAIVPSASTSKPSSKAPTSMPGQLKEKSSLLIGRKKKPIMVIKRKTFEKRPGQGPNIGINKSSTSVKVGPSASALSKLKIRKLKDKERDKESRKSVDERDGSSTPASTRTNSPAPPPLPTPAPATSSSAQDRVASIFDEPVLVEDRAAPKPLEREVEKKEEDVVMAEPASEPLPTPVVDAPTPAPAPPKEPTPPPAEPEAPKPPPRARLSLAAYRQRQAQQPTEPTPAASIEPTRPLVDTPQPMDESVRQPTALSNLTVQGSMTMADGSRPSSRPQSSSGPTSAFSTVSTQDMLKRLGDYFSSQAPPPPTIPARQRSNYQHQQPNAPHSYIRPSPNTASQPLPYRRSPSPPSPPRAPFHEPPSERERSPIGYTGIPRRSDVFRRPLSPPPEMQSGSGSGLGLDTDAPTPIERRRSSATRWDAPTSQPVSPKASQRRVSDYSPPRVPNPSLPTSSYSSNAPTPRPSPPSRPYERAPYDAPTGPRGGPGSPPPSGGFSRPLPFSSGRLSPDLTSPSFGTSSLPNIDGRPRPGPIPVGPRGFSGGSSNGSSTPSTPAPGRPSWPPRGGGPPFRGRGGRGGFSSPATPGSHRPHYDGIPTGPRTTPGPFRGGRGMPPGQGWMGRGRGRGRGSS